MSNSSENHEVSTSSLHITLITRANALLADLTAFQTYVQQHKTPATSPSPVELRTFKSSIRSELKSLEKLSAPEIKRKGTENFDQEGDDSEEDDSEEDKEGDRRRLHALRSSNLPFLEAVWSTARSCRGVKACAVRYYWEVEDKTKETHGGGRKACDENVIGDNGRKNGIKRKSVLVDIIAENGAEWVKVSTVTESRLLFEMAKKGWERDGSSDEGTDSAEDEARSEDEDDRIELITLAEDMSKAARAVRVRYRHPRIRFVLPKIIEGKTPEIDSILAEIRGTGARLDCGDAIAGFSSLSLEDAVNSNVNGQAESEDHSNDHNPFSTMLPTPLSQLTSTLNIDCTLLLALISDISNLHPASIPNLLTTHHRAITRQIELETQEPLLPTELWPAMSNNDLVCTSEAAKRMREIVATIGTDTEKSRADLLLAEGAADRLQQEDLIRGFQAFSEYTVPLHWKLPVKVVDAQAVIGAAKAKFPAVAAEVGKRLTEINRSVFLYGWASGWTTISSNRTVAKEIERVIQDNEGEDDEVVGPDVWVCGTARSLVGKEKGKRD